MAHLRERLAGLSASAERLVGSRLEAIARDPPTVLGAVSAWFAGALTGVMTTAVASVDFLLVPFSAYYILIDFPTWRGSLESLIPPRYQPAFHPLFDEIGASSRRRSCANAASREK